MGTKSEEIESLLSLPKHIPHNSLNTVFNFYLSRVLKWKKIFVQVIVNGPVYIDSTEAFKHVIKYCTGRSPRLSDLIFFIMNLHNQVHVSEAWRRCNIDPLPAPASNLGPLYRRSLHPPQNGSKENGLLTVRHFWCLSSKKLLFVELLEKLKKSSCHIELGKPLKYRLDENSYG